MSEYRNQDPSDRDRSEERPLSYEERSEMRKLQRQKELRTRLVVLTAVLAGLIVVLVLVLVFTLKKKNKTNTTENTAVTEVQQNAASLQDAGNGATGMQNIDAAASLPQEDPSAVQTRQSAGGTGTEAVPQAQIGTGTASVREMPEEMLLTSGDPGWHENDLGLWYSTQPGYCYCDGWQEIDGATYHFDWYGHADRGWKRIDGQSCYFDDKGAYVPGKDNSKVLAFTFDDGPSEGMDQILELCQQTGARVTFFMIGRQVENGGGVLPFITKYRCQLGNHSYTHANMNEKTPEECAADFNQGNDLIRQWSGGLEAEVVRFPYGNGTDVNAQAVGRPAINWDVDTLDWQSQDANAIIQAVMGGISDGNIILMHDRHAATVEACRYLFPTLIEMGYQLVTVSEAAAAKGIDLQPGVTYYGFGA